jgi:peptide/nickel transport system permease protein
VLRYTLRRVGASALLLFLVLTATFFLIHLAPGEPSRLFDNPRISAERRQELRQTYGLDRPLGLQYLTWMGSVLRGNWGYSISLGRPAFDVLLEKMPNTCLLVAAAVVVEHALGLVMGLLAAARAGTFVDRWIRIVSLVLFSIPVFWLALLAIELLTVRWGLFPTQQMRSEGARLMPPFERFLDLLHHLVLPATIFGVARCGAVARYVRNGLLDVLGQDYVRTARAKGLSPARVLWVHALPNALVPLVQRLGVALPIMLSGSLVIEVVFSWPGVGFAAFQAILQRDYPVILASTAMSGVLVALGSLLADLLQAWLDPRVRDAI